VQLNKSPEAKAVSRWRTYPLFILQLIGIAGVYFALAKFGLGLASINPSATPIWPATGFALGVMLLWGLRVCPAIFVAAFAVNATTAGTLATSAAIALGNTLEGVVGAYLLTRWSGGINTFTTPAGIARFALVSAGPATVISASVGVLTLSAAGFAQWANFSNIWMTWWLGDVAGALVVTPVVVLWVVRLRQGLRSFAHRDVLETIGVYVLAVAVGLVAFSPLLDHYDIRGPLGFLSILPLLWAALRRGPRDTATAGLILSAFAIWGALSFSGPFARVTLNESFLLLLMYMISTSVPCLALSADVAVRRLTEENLRRTHNDLDERVQRRTADLALANKALANEIEQRTRAELELRRQSMHLSESQRLANLGSWVWDVPLNSVTWSDQLFEIYGVKPESFRGTFEDFIERLHPDDRNRVAGDVMRAFQSGQGFRLEERIVRPDGEVRTLHSTGEVIKDDQGNAIQMLGVCLDVTERKRAETELEQAREQLTQAQKMEALGQLTGGIAHDFNNLLMIMSGHAQILERRLTEKKDLSSLDAIRTAASRGETLTRQLLTFSRRQSLTPVVLDLRQRIEAVREMMGASLRGNIELTCDIEDDIWPIEVDLGEFELALVNIAVNARDAMPQGGKISLSARNVRLKPGSAAGSLNGDFVALAMSDTGNGIPPELLTKIFEPFFTTKPIGKGTGLGLSQVHGFANQSGGAVTVNSEAGKGTVVTIYLPRSQTAPLAPDASSAAPDAEPVKGTVLVVEDSREVAKVTTTLLEQLGYRVVRAENAAEALRHLQQGIEVDLVFSDIVMPGGMNGIGLAQECKERYPDLPILLTSGYTDAAQSAESRFKILRKPFEMSALERALQGAFGNRGVRKKRAGGGKSRPGRS
jgi:PAS domain S-box-containing protein